MPDIRRPIEATLVYVKRGADWLMLHRGGRPGDIHAGKWNGLGGKVDAGESPLECAVRELREESGLEARGLRPCGHLTFPVFKDGIDWSVHVFLCDDFAGEPGDCSEGRLEWVPESQLLTLNLWEGDRHFLPYVISGRRFHGRFDYRDKKLAFWRLSLEDESGRYVDLRPETP
jgi:8-oxo-dGTP diphosphatase